MQKAENPGLYKIVMLCQETIRQQVCRKEWRYISIVSLKVKAGTVSRRSGEVLKFGYCPKN